MKPLRVVVWGEDIHERQDAEVAVIYPDGRHGAIAAGIRAWLPDADVAIATLPEPEHGLSAERLGATDVLTGWGHRGYAEVSDAVVDRAQWRVGRGWG